MARLPLKGLPFDLGDEHEVLQPSLLFDLGPAMLAGSFDTELEAFEFPVEFPSFPARFLPDSPVAIEARFDGFALL